MSRPKTGFALKWFWRQKSPLALYHCYRGLQGGGFISLCGRSTLVKSGGQAKTRPWPMLRCAMCDSKEMAMYEVEESLPASPVPKS